MEILVTKKSKDYELLDSGEGQKLERYGEYVLSRPDTQAIWQKKLGNNEWEKADAIFSHGAKSGKWNAKGKIKEKWLVNLNDVVFNLELLPSKHLGVFPEQSSQWSWIEDKIKSRINSGEKVKVLNLFGYTGGVSLYLASLGADITHIDASKQAILWANQNKSKNNLAGSVRFLLDDALKFTEKEFKNNERINCAFFFIINSFDSNNFNATLQVNSSRPVYNATYTTPVLNLNDKDVQFKYVEFENFIYDQNAFTSNLVSILSFYAHVIIGADADTFASKGGTEAYEKALTVSNMAQSSGYAGWVQTGKNPTRYNLISDLMSPTFDPYRETMYAYHIKGLDIMAGNVKAGKLGISSAIDTLLQLHKVRPNSLLARTFFDAKTDEIVTIFGGGPPVDTSKLIDALQTISPLNSSKWNKIK
jgi:hypothetical protein